VPNTYDNYQRGTEPSATVLESILRGINPSTVLGGARAAIQDTVLGPLDKLQRIADHPNAHIGEKIWAAGDTITRENKKVAIPLALLLRLMFMGNPETRKGVSQLLSQGSALAALPGIAIRSTDAISRLIDSEDKLRTLGEVAPSTLVRSLSDLSPSIIHQLSQLV